MALDRRAAGCAHLSEGDEALHEAAIGREGSHGPREELDRRTVAPEEALVERGRHLLHLRLVEAVGHGREVVARSLHDAGAVRGEILDGRGEAIDARGALGSSSLFV
jgi:hypothetical protein